MAASVLAGRWLHYRSTDCGFHPDVRRNLRTCAMREETPTDSRPHFVIPYWTPVSAAEAPDDGDVRPLPSKACWYLCPAIHASPYTPGEQLDVTVAVANYGGANTASLAQVAVW